MVTHFNILAYKISWTEEPGGLQSMVLHDSPGKTLEWVAMPSSRGSSRSLYIYVTESLCCTAEISTYKPTIVQFLKGVHKSQQKTTVR